MDNVYKQLSVREMLYYIDERPGMYLGGDEKRLDYLCHFLDGWLIIHDSELNWRYRAKITQWIYDWILVNNEKTNRKLKPLVPRYKMIYNITNNEEEAWELFYKISHDLLDYLES